MSLNTYEFRGFPCANTSSWDTSRCFLQAVVTPKCWTRKSEIVIRHLLMEENILPFYVFWRTDRLYDHEATAKTSYPSWVSTSEVNRKLFSVFKMSLFPFPHWKKRGKKRWVFLLLGFFCGFGWFWCLFLLLLFYFSSPVLNCQISCQAAVSWKLNNYAYYFYFELYLFTFVSWGLLSYKQDSEVQIFRFQHLHLPWEVLPFHTSAAQCSLWHIIICFNAKPFYSTWTIIHAVNF